jgi:hypothetical protein
MIVHIILYIVCYIVAGSFISGATSNWLWFKRALAHPPQLLTIFAWPFFFLYLIVVQFYFLGIVFAERILEVYNGYKIRK